MFPCLICVLFLYSLQILNKRKKPKGSSKGSQFNKTRDINSIQELYPYCSNHHWVEFDAIFGHFIFTINAQSNFLNRVTQNPSRRGRGELVRFLFNTCQSKKNWRQINMGHLMEMYGKWTDRKSCIAQLLKVNPTVYLICLNAVIFSIWNFHGNWIGKKAQM